MSAAVALIEQDLAAAIPRALRREPAKVLAFRLKISEQGARQIQTGQVLPRPEHLALLAREFPHIYATWLRCVHPEGDSE